MAQEQMPPQGGQEQDPQAMVQDAMAGIQAQIDAISGFAAQLGQMGKQEAAAKFDQGAKLLSEGLASLGATKGGPQPVAGVDEMGGTAGQKIA